MDAMEASFPDVVALGAGAARAQMREMLNGRAIEPEPVGEVEDSFIPGPDGRLPVRVYRPAARARAVTHSFLS
jgi:acetyl esterase